MDGWPPHRRPPRRTVWLVVLMVVASMGCSSRRTQGVAITLERSTAVSTSLRASATAAGAAIAVPAASYPVALGTGVPADLLARDGLRYLRPAAGAEPALTLAPVPPHEGIPARYWLPVTDLFNDATAISGADLARALRGDAADWQQLGASPAPVHVYLPAEHADELRALLGDTLPEIVTLPTVDGGSSPVSPLAAPTRPTWLTKRGVIAAVGLERGALALLPIEDVDFRVRALALDGVDLFRGTGDPGSYALATRIGVADGPAAHPASMLSTVTRELTARLPVPERVLATGDIIPARCVYERQRRFGDYRHAFLEVAPTLRAADLAIGSLDAAISDKGTPIGCKQTISLLAPADSVQGISYAGIGLLTVAANHAKDCGETACGDLAFLDTLAALDAAGVKHTGGGRNLEEARSPAMLTVKGVRFAFLGYDDIASRYYGAGEHSPGTAPLDLATLALDVRAAKARADVVVVLVHWGTEYTADPTARQRQAAKLAVDAGATLVIGNHPHVVQAVEVFAGGFAGYALGNFVFDQDWSQETLEGVVLEAVFDGTRLRQVGFLPLRIRDMHQPHFLPRDQGRPILDRMQRASTKLVGR